jgi:hypothetical protein
MTEIKLTQHEHWAAFAVTGLITAPVIPLGEGPDMYLAPGTCFGEASEFLRALHQSFDSFGLKIRNDITFTHPKVLLVPLTDGSDIAVKNALMAADMALAFFDKKYFFAKARFLNWDRRSGAAVGTTYANGEWKPIVKPPQMAGPGIVRHTGKDFWDWFLGASLRNQLPELGERLFKCLEWERESEFSPHITHRFAFLWIGLEAMLPVGECDEGAVVRRYSLVAFAPRGADTRVIRDDPAMRSFFEQNPNPNAKKWAQVIQEMYRYRCAILHDGSTDLNSVEINPKKIEWFYQVAKHLMTRVEGLAINALIDKEKEIGSFWSSYVLSYLYSSRNHWLSNGTLLRDDLITFDWENTKYPELV